MQSEEPETLDEASALLSDAIPAAERILEEFRALEPPPGGEKFYKRYVSTTGTQVDLLKQAQEAADEGNVQQLQELIQEGESVSNKAQGLAQGYGFEVCGMDRG